MTKIDKFIRLSNRAIEIAESNLSWSTKYDMILLGDISRDLNKLFKMEWLNTGITGQQDIESFIKAVKEKRDELLKLTKSA